MARKLTESQKVIRRLQSQFTNKEIAQLIGYKSTSSVTRIASGKQELNGIHKHLADSVLQIRNIRKTAPTKKQLKEYRKKKRNIRKKNPNFFEDIVYEIFPEESIGGRDYTGKYVDKLWRKSSFEDFMFQAYINNQDKKPELREKLEKRGLTITYYNPVIDRYLLSNAELDLNNIDPFDFNEMLYYTYFEVNYKDGQSHFVTQFPIYRWQNVLPRDQYANSLEIEQELEHMEEEDYNPEITDKGLEEYGYLNKVEYAWILAYVHEV